MCYVVETLGGFSCSMAAMVDRNRLLKYGEIS